MVSFDQILKCEDKLCNSAKATYQIMSFLNRYYLSRYRFDVTLRNVSKLTDIFIVQVTKLSLDKTTKVCPV